MMILIIAGIAMFGLIAAGMIELWRAPLMPESWVEETGEYVKCDDCIWDNPDASVFGRPGYGCVQCPYCNTLHRS